MPIVRLPDKLLYFAHVPKCAGTAIENYLIERFGPLGFLDRGFNRRGPQSAWSMSPPQHIPEAVRSKLLPDTLFDASFATVRHPAHRLRSAFHFQREVERVLPPGLNFGTWLEDLPRVLATEPGAWNGHVRPVSDFVPEQAQVFRVEDGLAPMIAWLDTQAGNSDGPREVASANARAARQDKLDKPQPLVALSPKHLAMIKQLYAADYARFGYAESPEKES